MSPKVAILLATFNGEKYLDEQLISIVHQTHTNWKIYASDDNSSDSTISILKNFQEIYGKAKIEILNGLCNGSTNNFLFALNNINESFDYYAFCDQDDRWDSCKLEVAISKLANFRTLPALYCGSSRYISSDGNYLQNSYIFKNPPSFKNALVQSIAGGNTMVFNLKAAILLSRTPKNNTLIAHDWWLYILVSAYEGYIFYDKTPYLDYRQHLYSLVGENRSVYAKFLRVKKLLNGSFKIWSDENLRILNYFQSEISKNSKETMNFFKVIKVGSLQQRLYAFFYSGIRRQTFNGNLAMLLGIIIKKI